MFLWEHITQLTRKGPRVTVNFLLLGTASQTAGVSGQGEVLIEKKL